MTKRKRNLNKETIELINKALLADSDLSKLMKRLELSRNWLYAAKKDQYDIRTQIVSTNKAVKALDNLDIVIDELRAKL